ncbi:MAG: response regulator [Polyangiaceae bacterium]|nr:response regulator [Polyangiaceae bacterium]
MDDDPIALEATAEWLESAGFRVTRRSDVLGTTNEVYRLAPNVVLLDVGLPGLSGEVLAKLIQADDRLARVAVILYSARPALEIETMSTRCGALGAIHKTGDRERFLRAFRRVIAMRWPHEAGGGS